MSAEDQVIRLVLETKGKESIEALAKSTQNYKGLLEESVKAFAKGEISAEQFTAAQAKLGGEFGRQTALLEKLQAAQRGEAAAAGATASAALRVGDAADKAGNKMAGFGQAGMQAGRVFQDFWQGGIGGILNNIEGLSLALGGTAGLAGALTILGVLAFAFKDKIKSVFDAALGEAVNAGVGHVERLQGRIKELEEKPVKLAVDVLALENARKEVEQIKEALATVERLRKSQGYYEKESGRAIAETFAEEGPGGAGGVIDDLVRGMTGEMAATSGPLAEARKEMAKLHDQIRMTEISGPGAFPEGDTKEAAIARLQKELAAARERANVAFQAVEKAAAAEVGGTYKTATEGTGPAQLAAQEKLQRFLQTRGFGGLAGSVAANAPAAAQAQEEADAAFEAQLARMAAARPERRRRDAAQEAFEAQVGPVQAGLATESLFADREAQKKAAEKAAAEHGAEDRKRRAAQVKEGVKAFEATPLDELAAAGAARMQAGGADETQRLIALSSELARRIKASPLGKGMTQTMQQDVAVKMAQDAIEQADQLVRSNEATLGMGRAGLSKDQQAQIAVAASAAAIEELALKFEAENQAWAGLAGRINAARARLRGR